MHRITLIIIFLLAATAVDAAWYQKTDGTIVDPIQLTYIVGDHSYGGNNLQPSAYLNNAHLRYADLDRADLYNAYLLNADLHNAHLRNADMSHANLYNADLSYADLTGADLTNANLGYAHLYSANLTGAYLTGADLTGADLTGAYLTGADLSGSDFSNVVHYGHSDGTSWTDAFYYTDNEPNWHSNMAAAWRTSVGILALDRPSTIPEPSTLLLAVLGLALLPRRRRR